MTEDKDFLDKVYPWIKCMEGEPTENGLISVVYSDDKEYKVSLPQHVWMADLDVLYVIDRGDHFEILQSNLLPDGIDEQLLFEIACNNLNRDIEFRAVGTNWGGLGVICGGNFEASSICLPHITEFIGEQYQKDYIMAVPARDMMITALADDEEQITGLKESVKRIMKDGDHCLSKKLFHYSIETHEFTVCGEVFC